MINKVVLIGNLGKDPESKEVKEQTLSKFSLATTEKYKNKKGELISHTEWHNVECWGGLALIVKKHLSKGDLIYLEGKIQNRKYELNGENRTYPCIIADSIKMLPSGNKNKEIKIKDIADNNGDDLPW